MELDYNYKIAQLITKKLSKCIDNNEQNELNEWINTSESNKKYYAKITNLKNRKERNNFVNSLDIKKDLINTRSKLGIKRAKKINLSVFYRVAAVLATGLFIYFTVRYVSNDFKRIKKEYAANKIQIGSSKATLVLHSGKAIDIESIKNKNIAEQDGTLINNNSGELKYESKKDKKDKKLKEIYNLAIIPRGGELNITLSDGTKVSINSASSLRYPVHFYNNKRVVYLEEGEAFFEVAKDQKHPFIVKTRDGLEIEVLGTGFNVKSYKQEQTFTTLNTGNIKIRINNKETCLTPDMQAIYNNNTGSLTTKHVDARIFSAWKDGLFVFDDATLGEIGTVLSRWYDIEFFFTNEEVKNYHFTGGLKRYEEPETIFNLLEKASNVKFILYENSIVVEKNS